MPSFKLAILLRADLTKGQFVQLPVCVFLYVFFPVSPSGSENLLVIIWSESSGVFTICHL